MASMNVSCYFGAAGRQPVSGWFRALGMAALLIPCLTSASDDGAREASRSAVKVFASTLQGELQAAMQSGGPQKAISVCHTRAPEIAESVSAEQGLNIRRTSLKARNPENRPEPWQEAVLEHFEERRLAGQNPQQIEHFERTEDGGFRYMKAIPTGELCLVCHGRNVPETVTQSLDELYPEDRATGYELGDIRGAFVVTQP